MWGNLGVSLLGFTGAIFVLYPIGDAPRCRSAPRCSRSCSGTVLGTRGGVDRRRSPAPRPAHRRWSCCAGCSARGCRGCRPCSTSCSCSAGRRSSSSRSARRCTRSPTACRAGCTSSPAASSRTALALRPLGWIRVLRRYVTVAVVVALVYLAVQLLRNPLPALGHGTVERLLDRRRHAWSAWPCRGCRSRPTTPGTRSRCATPSSARSSATRVTQIACYAIGLVALVTVAKGDDGRDLRRVHGRPGRHARLRGAGDPRDRPVLRRHVLDRGVGAEPAPALGPAGDRGRARRAVATVAGARARHRRLRELPAPASARVFVPLLGVFAVDYFVISRRTWDLGESAPRALVDGRALAGSGSSPTS